MMSNANILGNINKIEGFVPLQYATKLPPNVPGEPEIDFLKLEARRNWFWMIYPQGKIEKILVSQDAGSVVMEARLYADRNDPPEKFISNAFGTATKEGSAEALTLSDLFTNAEAEAVRRALATAGFDLPPPMRDDSPPDSPPESTEMSVEDAKNFIIQSGKHQGKSLGNLALEKPEGLNLIVENSGKYDAKVVLAAKILIAHGKKTA